ncbi:MAG: tol-pal system-associated acyl-CoA thioesterase [Mariprofundales bacterium]
MPWHKHTVRIYYEDTDHGQIVYYANYLKFMERGRTEYLRNYNFELDSISHDFGVLFVVQKVMIDFLQPAHFNDLISINSRVIHAKGARLFFEQNIWRKNKQLVAAEIQLACIDKSGKPARIPAPILNVIDISTKGK